MSTGARHAGTGPGQSGPTVAVSPSPGRGAPDAPTAAPSGAEPSTPRRSALLELGLRGWSRAAWQAVVRAARDRITTSAAGLAFHWFLAIFPALVALLGLAGLVGLSRSQIASVVHGASVILPGQMANLLDQALRNPGTQSGSALELVIGSLVALWAGIEAMAALEVALDMAFEIPTDRGFLRRRLMALPMLGAMILLGGTASVLLVLGDPIRSLLPASFSLAQPAFDVAWALVRWFGAVVLVILLVSTLYVIGTDRPDRRWEWVSPGSVIATLGWLAASAGFAFYLDHFGRETQTFGVFAGVAVLLLWLFLTANALLLGAELNGQLRRAVETSRAARTPAGGGASASGAPVIEHGAGEPVRTEGTEPMPRR